MALPAIKWTPTGESSEQTLSFPRMVSTFRGFREVDREQSFSRGGAAVSIVHDCTGDYDVELLAFSPSVDVTFFGGLTSWWSHAARGGEFRFFLDSADYLDTTMSAATQGATTFSVSSTATLATLDYVYIEDASDPTEFEWRQVTNISGGTLTVSPALSRGYTSGSVVRHAEYHPKCIIRNSAVPFRERGAGQGNRLWDLRFSFRTVR